MIHDLVHYEHLVTLVDDRQRGLHRDVPSSHARAWRRPGRTRRAAASGLVRLAERLAKQPAATLLEAQVTIRPRGT